MARKSRLKWIFAIGAVFIIFIVATSSLNLGGGGGSPITQQFVNQQIAALKPSSNSTTGFSVMYTTVSYGNPNHNSISTMQADLAMLQSTSASCIREDLNFPLASNIPSVSGCVILADAASQSYYSNPLPWSQFKVAWVNRVTSMASAVHPQYYIVIKEPGWYVPMVSDALTNPLFRSPSDWLNLTQALISAVQSVSPNTKIGVSIAADVGNQAAFYTTYLNGISSMPGVSFIGFDIYNQAGFADTQAYLNQYGAGNKNVWIAEAWSGTGSVAFDPSRAQLDKSWMLMLYYYALSIHATNIIPFYTDCFSGYTQPVNYSQRTPVYFEFSGLASQYGVAVR